MNKLLMMIAATLATVWPLTAAAQEQGSREKKFFFRGSLEAGVALNARGFDGGWREGLDQNLSRYRIRGELFAGREVSWGPVEEVFILWEPDFLLGRGSGEYDFSPAVTGIRRRYGVGFTVDGWKIYAVTNNRWWKHDREAWGDGPGGLHNMVFVRTPDLNLTSPDSRLSLTGYLDIGSSWPRNEYELGLRRPDLPETGGYGDNFSRYQAKGELFVRYRLDAREVRDVFVLWEPDFHLGRTVPQRHYTWSPRYIGARVRVGAGVTFQNEWSVYAVYNNWHFADQQAVGTGPGGEHLMFMVRAPAFSWRF